MKRELLTSGVESSPVIRDVRNMLLFGIAAAFAARIQVGIPGSNAVHDPREIITFLSVLFVSRGWCAVGIGLLASLGGPYGEGYRDLLVTVGMHLIVVPAAWAGYHLVLKKIRKDSIFAALWAVMVVALYYIGFKPSWAILDRLLHFSGKNSWELYTLTFRSPLETIVTAVCTTFGALFIRISRRANRERNEHVVRLQAEVAERVQAEEEVLRESEARWRSLTETSPDHILTLDTDLNIRFANFASPGLTVKELVGTPLYAYVDEERQAEIKAVLEGVLKTGELDSYETIYDVPDGGIIHYESRVVPRRLPGSDEIIGLTLSARDITARVQAEEQINAALADKVVLLREIQHRVRNNLQSLSYLIDLQSEGIEAPETLRALKALQGRIRAMALVHEKLDRQDLARIDFREYLDSLMVHLYQVYGGGRGIAMHVEADCCVDVSIAMPCGLIVNELMSNALQHAFPSPPLSPPPGGMKGGAEIRVTLGLHEGEYVLTVGDNGVGLPPETDGRARGSFGLELVDVWATHQLRGSVEVDTHPGEGTVFTIRFPERRQE